MVQHVVKLPLLLNYPIHHNACPRASANFRCRATLPAFISRVCCTRGVETTGTTISETFSGVVAIELGKVPTVEKWVGFSFDVMLRPETMAFP